ncbi:MAG TPA: GDSL-type esterase/lipase family protein [Planctomycetota bacterium]|nr:GDSL-type esterase/lipase family protein [Planctomycetota bacterium]
MGSIGKASPRARWLVTVLALPVALGVMELALRVAGFEHAIAAAPLVLGSERMLAAPADGPGTHCFDAATLWSPRPGAVLTPDLLPTINGLGYRGPELAAARAPGSLRVALLGESVLFGFGVAADEAVTARLSRELQGAAPVVEVFNASVIGFTIVQGLERYRALVRPLHPDVVCVAFGNHNEAAPAHGRPDTDLLAAARAELHGWSGVWLAMRSDLRVLQGLQWLADRSRGPRGAATSGAPCESGDLDAYGTVEWPGARRVPLGEFRDTLRTLADEIAADGGRLVLCQLPLRPAAVARYPIMARYGEVMEQVARERGAQFLDVRPALAHAALAAGTGDFFLPADPWHLNAAGQALLAGELARAVRGAGECIGGARGGSR